MSSTPVQIDETTLKNVNKWLESDIDEASKQAILALMHDNPQELVNAFYQDLDFGTGGLRGIVGIGSNRMNKYTIRSATQGLANYIKKQNPHGSCVISYDSRTHSFDFAKETASVLAGNGIKVFLFEHLRPVPLISFAVRHLNATAGVMITASHNPPEYNGYKVYWSEGAQVLPPHDKGIIQEVHQVKDIHVGQWPHPLVSYLKEEMDEAYLAAIRPLQLFSNQNQSQGHQLQIVYTALHGSGITLVPKALKSWGFTNVTLVEEQSQPDGNFPTVKSPNPEEPSALKMAIDLMEKKQADLVIGTDPDSDRLGVAVMHNGQTVILNGNEVACLCTEHICQALKQTDGFPPKPVFVKTIVTSELMKAIAEANGCQCPEVLTGFKYIGEQMEHWAIEAQSGLPFHHFLFGGEESYGYLLGTHARDKDAIVSASLVAEMALHLKLKGKTLVDSLHDIYHKYGVFKERLASVEFKGKTGAEKMNQLMQSLRSNPPRTIAGIDVEFVEDYLTHVRLSVKSGATHTLTLPKSNVLRIWLTDGTKIVVRPSGTEPKLKLYCGVVYNRHTHIHEAIESCNVKLNTLLTALKQMMGAE
jgi:phosphomannomutase